MSMEPKLVISAAGKKRQEDLKFKDNPGKIRETLS
jgi:hypothetical protein